MKRQEFISYIENTRDCDLGLLDIAVNKGLNRAKNEELDFKKFAKLAAMCAATVVLCISMSLEHVKLEASNYLRSNSVVTQRGSEVLHTYLLGVADSVKTYFGGN